MKNTSDRKIFTIVAATGIASVVTQLFVIREFLTRFAGNEFVIALILFNWLLLGGFGTLISRFAGPRADTSRLSWACLGLLVLSPLEILAIRCLRDVFFLPGASVGFYPTFFFSSLVTAPYALLLGFSLPYSLRVARNQNPEYPGVRIYIFDNLGDACGGALFSFLLVYYLTPFQAILAAHLPLAAALWWAAPGNRLKKPMVPAILAAMIVLASAVIVEKSTLARQGTVPEYYRESPYGRVEVLASEGEHTLFMDGKPYFSTQNLEMAEQVVHYPLSQIDAPKRVLLISAVSGIMEQLDKYRLESVDYVEIDPEVSRAVLAFGMIRPIPALNIIHMDGRAFLKHTGSLYDAILINLPEPDTFQVNRFFTDRFFEIAGQHLAPHGVLSFFVEGFDSYMTEQQRRKLSCLYATARTRFEHVLLVPGANVCFLCANRPLRADIPARLESAGIKTDYISGYFYGDVSSEKMADLNRLAGEGSDAPVNADLSPRLIRLTQSFWFSRFASSPLPFYMILAGGLILYGSRLSREEYVLFSTGWTVMGSEILVIFAFQIFFGYIYLQIGLIITAFLAGLLPGAVIGGILHRNGRRILLMTDIGIGLLLGTFIWAVIAWGDRVPPALFLIFGFILAVLCGIQFPAALLLGGETHRAAVGAFSADLMGAAFGTLVTSIVLIPAVGIVWTAIVLLLIKSSSFIMVAGYRDAPIPQTVHRL